MHKVNSLTPMEYAVMQYRVTVPNGVTIEDLKKPAAWSHVARELQPFHLIYAYSEDGTWFAMLMVRAASRIEAQVAVLLHQKFTEEADVDPAGDEYTAAWVSPTKRWGVKRTSDGEWVAQDIQTKEEAVEKAKGLATAMAA